MQYMIVGIEWSIDGIPGTLDKSEVCERFINHNGLSDGAINTEKQAQKDHGHANGKLGYRRMPVNPDPALHL
jgi:hypothetical protein